MTTQILADKVAIITGAGSGIGAATARLFAAEGARVVAVDRDQGAAQATVQLIAAGGGQALAVGADVSVPAEVAAAVDEAERCYGRLDLIFNGAGVSGRRWGDGPAAECTEEAWDLVLSVNLKSVFLGCKYAIPAMQRAGGGAIINLGSVLGLVGGDADFATHAYAASKGGIVSLTRAIAVYYAPHHIRANAICPGLIATPMSRRAQESAAIRERLAQLQPLTADFGQPDDVAQAALYFASDAARFVTGVVLPVDGGWTAQ